MPNERYIGDGVYASLDPARMIVLRTERMESSREPTGIKLGDTPVYFDRHTSHWIGLEPQVLHELIAYAYEIGWGPVVEDSMMKVHQRAPMSQSDAEYARDEEDKQRKRDAAEGFPDEDA